MDFREGFRRGFEVGFKMGKKGETLKSEIEKESEVEGERSGGLGKPLRFYFDLAKRKGLNVGICWTCLASKEHVSSQCFKKGCRFCMKGDHLSIACKKCPADLSKWG